MKKNVARILALVLVIAMLAGCCFYMVYIIADGNTSYTAYAAELSAQDKESLKKIDQLKDVVTYIKENYKEDVDIDKLINGAYNGVFNELDPWSVYYSTVEEEQDFLDALSEGETFEGVGVTIQKDAGQTVVVSLLPAGDAFEQGIKSGDVIVSIDGVDCRNWDLNSVSQSLRGTAGTTVKIGIERRGNYMEFTCTRRQLTQTEISAEVIEGTDIGYIRIASFSSMIYWDFLDAYFKLIDQGISGFVIDVRNNGGGYMDEAMNCAAALLKPGQEVLTYKNADGVIDTYTVIGDEQPYENNKYVVLINEYTASAAEAFAAALKENKAATIVGTNTYGKGSAQIIQKIDDTTSYKLSTMFFYGPNDYKIEGNGIKPDYIVYNNAGLTAEEAAEIASKIIPMSEKKKYMKKGLYGLNVLAAQGRLKAMGYKCETTGILDDITWECLKDIQKSAGGSPWGGLDYFTQNAVVKAFDAFLYGTGDAQLQKAVDLLK